MEIVKFKNTNRILVLDNLFLVIFFQFFIFLIYYLKKLKKNYIYNFWNLWNMLTDFEIL